MAKRTDLQFYDYGRVLSYNAQWNFITGARGTGKTYGAKRIAIKNFLEKGEQFIYLRRYRPELKAFQTFAADMADEFPDVPMRTMGNEFQIQGGDGKWSPAGWAISLSTVVSQKSRAFPNVTLIIFDEFIIEGGVLRYLPDEADVFEGFYSTVDRWRDQVKVFFLANAASISNPYYIKYGISPDREFARYHNKYMLVHTSKSDVFAQQVRITKFGQMLAATGGDSADYMMNAVFTDGHYSFIGPKPSKARYFMSVDVGVGQFHVWSAGSEYWVTLKAPKREEFLMSVTTKKEHVTETRRLVEFSDPELKMLRTAYKHGNVVFASPKARGVFSQVFKR